MILIIAPSIAFSKGLDKAGNDLVVGAVERTCRHRPHALLYSEIDRMELAATCSKGAPGQSKLLDLWAKATAEIDTIATRMAAPESAIFLPIS
jgi:hypothetical protein